MQGKNSGER